MDSIRFNDFLTACQDGNITVIKDRLDNYPHYINKQNTSDGYTPLVIASMFGHKDLIRILIEKGANATVVNMGGTKINASAIFFPCQRGNLEIVKILIDAGFDINYKTKFGYTPLIAASRGGHLDIVKLLLSYPQIDIFARDNTDHLSALSYAIKNKNIDIIANILLTMDEFAFPSDNVEFLKGLLRKVGVDSESIRGEINLEEMGKIFDEVINKSVDDIYEAKELESLSPIEMEFLKQTIKCKNLILVFFKILYHKFIFLSFEGIQTLIQTLLHEGLSAPFHGVDEDFLNKVQNKVLELIYNKEHITTANVGGRKKRKTLRKRRKRRKTLRKRRK